MIIPIFVIGLISSVITEILKLFPVLSFTDTRKRIVAFGVSFIISTLYVISQEQYRGLGALALIIGAVGASFAVYKSIIQIARPPVETE